MTVLLVASVGGHLVELHQLAPRLDFGDSDRIWITYDNAQSNSLLDGEKVIHVPMVTIRDVVGVMRNWPVSRRILAEHDVRAVVSTGSGIALGVLPVAATGRVPCHYIESATRIQGISMTGRILDRVPGVAMYHQYPTGGGRGWSHGGSVYDGYESHVVETGGPIERVVVTVGTMVDYGFRRLVERMIEIVPAGVEVFWQTGSTDVTGLDIDARGTVPTAELDAAIAAADVVVAHGGVGSTVTALDAGRLPVVVPREAAFDENVDDHQVVLAARFESLGLAITSRAAGLEWSHLEAAATHAIGRRSDPPPFALTPNRSWHRTSWGNRLR